MTIFKRKKRLKKLDDCPYIKDCGFKDSSLLYSCRDGGYIGCSIYRSNIDKDKKTKEEGEEKS